MSGIELSMTGTDMRLLAVATSPLPCEVAPVLYAVSICAFRNQVQVVKYPITAVAEEEGGWLMC